MEIMAVLGALMIGFSLGLLGSGGSIITIPILIFIVNRPEKLAIAESLGIVSFVAFMGAIPYALRFQINWKTVIYFGLPGMCGAYLGAFVSHYVSEKIQLILFSIIMCVVARIMLFPRPSSETSPLLQRPLWMVMLIGLGVGLLTGFIGVGGGFLIVPSLFLFAHLPMVFAIGSSLIIIGLNSLSGFIEQLRILDSLDMKVSWETITLFAIAGTLGSFIGSLLSNRISQLRLKQAFGFNALLIALYILVEKT